MAALMSMDPMYGADSDPVNPFNVESYVFTIVTAELETSLQFYRDMLGYRVIAAGELGQRLPTVAGAGAPGRRYILLRPVEDFPTERGLLRLLEAPKGAAANRPRPGAASVDGGLVCYQTTTRHWDEAYRHLIARGLTPTSPPLFYPHRRITPLPDEPAPPRTGSKSLSLYVPGGGEFLYISCQVDPASLEPVASTPNRPLFGPISAHVIGMRDRWPFLDFYDKAFGLKSITEGYAGRESINRLCDLPRGTQFQYGFMAGMCMEWWELRQFRPMPAPAWPTSLDKTGFAMTTFLVDDLAAIRDRVQANGYALLGQGALPTPDGNDREGFYVRGVEGELYEVIGRD
jgi:catechol 2,3-dioxygenase-like lactoylglutathione lyase family enzyme